MSTTFLNFFKKKFSKRRKALFYAGLRAKKITLMSLLVGKNL